MKRYIKIKLIAWMFFGIKFTKNQYYEHKEAQYQKGFAKYGLYLEDQPDNYADWNIEALQELIDCQEYADKKKNIKIKHKSIKDVIHFFLNK